MPLSTTTSDVKAITGVSIAFDTVMVSGVQYVLRGTTDLWYRISAPAGTAAVANTDENHFLAKGQTALVAAQGAATKVTAIRDSGDGYASLSTLQGVA